MRHRLRAATAGAPERGIEAFQSWVGPAETQGVHPTSAASAVADPVVAEPQNALLAELLDVVAAGRLELDELLHLVVDRLAEPCGLVAARVGSECAANRFEDVLPLRLFGEDLGALTLTYATAARLREEVARTIAHHTAVVLRAAVNRSARAVDDATSAAVRRLFEEGTRAGSIRAAGEVLARVTAEVLGTERVAVHLTDADGRVHDLLDLGIPADVADSLRAQVLGRLAGDSPIWRETQRAGTPVLADDAAAHPGRPGGFVETMRLRSYVAMPLQSADGTVGMIVCGDVSAPRVWTDRDRRLAHQLALEGALVVDSARLRQSEREHLEVLRHLAEHDALTGLPNRRRLLTEIASALPSCTGGLLLLDLDGFKDVNDTLGHHAGDVLLREVGRRLSGQVRAEDVAARLGGDEFAVLVNGATAAEATELAARLETVLEEPVDVEGRPVQVGASIGIAMFADHAQDVTGLLRAADARMYAVKRGTG